MIISCVQMNMLAGRPNENFARAKELLTQTASSAHPDVLVLPETWNTGFAPGKLDPALADEDGARTKEVFSALAKELGINIVAGSVANRRQGKLYNTAYVFDRAGQCITAYDKTHLFSPMGEDAAFEKGGALMRFTLDSATCAVIVCYDLRFPELIRTLALPGLDILFVVSQWPQSRLSHLSILSRARAIENQMFVALCNSCSDAFGTRFGGCSAIIDPWGELLAQAEGEETAIFAQVDLQTLAHLRATIPVFRDRRPELYNTDR